MEHTNSGLHPTIDRRKHERRINPYPFNSPEWVAMMREHYVLWPKQDRRQPGNYDRRKADRREKPRENLVASLQSLRNPQRMSQSGNLTDEEIQYIIELFNQDAED